MLDETGQMWSLWSKVRLDEEHHGDDVEVPSRYYRIEEDDVGWGFDDWM